jgi:hypothetical protein
MITDYEVITATRIADLQGRIRERLLAGWQPMGGLALLQPETESDDPGLVFAQVVVRYGSTSQGPNEAVLSS